MRIPRASRLTWVAIFDRSKRVVNKGVIADKKVVFIYFR